MSMLIAHTWLKSLSIKIKSGRKVELKQNKQTSKPESAGRYWKGVNRMHWIQYLEVELFSCSTKSLKDIQCRVATIHVFRTEIMLNKFVCLLLNPTFNFFSAWRKRRHNSVYREKISIITSDQRQINATYKTFFGPWF